MFDFVQQWYQRHFSDPQVVILALILISVFAVVALLGDVLVPVIVALVLAYLLEGLVLRMQGFNIRRNVAVSIVLLAFLILSVFLAVGVIPLLTKQIGQLFRDMPSMIEHGKVQLEGLLATYPNLFSPQQIQDILDSINTKLLSFGQDVVTGSLASAIDVFSFLVYAVLVPLMVLFALKDKAVILQWCKQFLPQKRDLASEVWYKMDIKIGNYVRGKFIEIMIIWVMTYIAFAFMGLKYAMLLSFLVGMSVIIPYVGAVTVTVPVALIAYFQWGLGHHFWWLISIYTAIQILDGNVIVPILFSEVVNLHPIAIVVAILFFGGLWGLWGIFFAIPLATLVDTVLRSWPTLGYGDEDENETPSHAS